jgi:hypothetical protein
MDSKSGNLKWNICCLSNGFWHQERNSSLYMFLGRIFEPKNELFTRNTSSIVAIDKITLALYRNN